MKKSELQQRVSESGERLLGVLDGLTEDEASRVGLTEKWSIKDALSHISAWELEGARIVSEIQAGTWQPSRPSKEQIDDFNARAALERKGRSLAELQAEFSDAHARMEAVVAALPDEVDESAPAYKYIEAVTIKHLPHHAEQIEKFRG
ncbi:MAG: DinB family protein [Acidobacteria bacterium]|nr:DinB family protein [Acidobacteriota bacterium]